MGSRQNKEAGGLALDLTTLLASGIGPRRPGSSAELEAALAMRRLLVAHGLDVRLSSFSSRSSFGSFYGPLFAAAALAGLVPRRLKALRAGLSITPVIAGAREDRFGGRSIASRVFKRSSQNVVSTIEPSGPAQRTLCLVSHMDSSRSGWMFHPRVTPHLGTLVSLVGLSLGIQGMDPLLGGRPAGRGLVRAARLVCALAAGIVLERELRGVDVAGANDNASGAAVSVVLAGELASNPLQHTRVVLLITGSEESGVLGMRAFLRSIDTSEWVFLNFDGVGGRAPLRYLEREGGRLQSWPADERMLAVAARIAGERAEGELTPRDSGSGLPYDSTPVLAGGGRAMTLSVQGRSIPNYHAPTDTADQIDLESLERALSVGREMIAAIDRGEAD